MEISEKIELNKIIKKYTGQNSFILSLKKNLTSKYCKKELFGEKEFKVLSDKQYESAKLTLGI